jgi:hypothetical protein
MADASEGLIQERVMILRGGDERPIACAREFNEVGRMMFFERPTRNRPGIRGARGANAGQRREGGSEVRLLKPGALIVEANGQHHFLRGVRRVRRLAHFNIRFLSDEVVEERAQPIGRSGIGLAAQEPPGGR